MMWGKENAWTRVFAVSQQFLCLVKTSDLGVDKQNRHCGSEQRRRHLTRGVCECQSPLPLGEVYCTGQVKCVFHHMWKAGLISRPNFNQGTFRSLQRALNILSSSVNICEEVIYSFGFYWQNNWRQDRKQVLGGGVTCSKGHPGRDTNPGPSVHGTPALRTELNGALTDLISVSFWQGLTLLAHTVLQ